MNPRHTEPPQAISKRGMVSTALATVIACASLALPALQDWYVDVNFPLCPGGTGTEARPFCNIMDAVSVAADGDTIHIAPGTYLENVVIEKDLGLVGTGGQAVTIVDGGGAGSVVRVELASVSLVGLTLTNGASSRGGGGLYVDNSNVYEPELVPMSLVSCSIVGNSAAWDGGGIGAQYAALVVTDCEIRDNSSGRAGGGVAWYGQAYIAHSSIDGNSAAEGGGIWGGYYCDRGECPFTGPALSLTNSSASGNLASVGGGLLHLGSASLSDVSVNSNTGSGIVSRGYAVLQNLTVSGNTEAGIEVGPVYGPFGPYASQAEIRNSLLVQNGGAGLSVRSEGHATVVNSTLSRNAGAGISVDAELPGHTADLALANSVVFDNGLVSITLANGALAGASFSLVENGWPGIGNLDLDPLFVDAPNGDFRLQPGSLCIDAGDNLAVPFGLWTDLDGKRRFIDGTGAGLGPRRWPFVDLGAYEFGHEPPSKVRRR